jgi:hypothetical protein
MGAGGLDQQEEGSGWRADSIRAREETAGGDDREQTRSMAGEETAAADPIRSGQKQPEQRETNSGNGSEIDRR